MLDTMQGPGVPLSAFLQPEPTHLAVTADVDQPASTTNRSRGPASKKFQFEDEHAEEYMRNGIKWPPVLPAATAGLTQREREVLYLRQSQYPSPNVMCALDVNQSITWGAVCEGKLPCLVGSSRCWVWGPNTNRLLRGSEALCVQGLMCRPGADMEFGDRFLLELAGNAFTGSVVVPAPPPPHTHCHRTPCLVVRLQRVPPKGAVLTAAIANISGAQTGTANGCNSHHVCPARATMTADAAEPQGLVDPDHTGCVLDRA